MHLHISTFLDPFERRKNVPLEYLMIQIVYELFLAGLVVNYYERTEFCRIT